MHRFSHSIVTQNMTSDRNEKSTMFETGKINYVKTTVCG